MEVVPGRISEALAFRGYTMKDLDVKLNLTSNKSRMWNAGLKEVTPYELMLIARITRFPIKFFTSPPKINVIDEGSFYCDFD